MNRRAVFFDRDNTLIIGNDYLGDPAKVVLVPGAADAVARARAMGYATVIVSNQSGVARGMFGEDDVRAVNARMDAMLIAENAGATIDRHEFCPFHPQAPVEKYRVDSDSRKPRPGMLLTAAKEMGLDLSHSWIIGDAARDVEAGRAAGCHTILFNDMTLPLSPAARSSPRVPPDFTASSLKEAMDHIAASDGTAAAPASTEEESSMTIADEGGGPPTTPVAAPVGTAVAAPVEVSIAKDLSRVLRASGDEATPLQDVWADTTPEPDVPPAAPIDAPAIAPKNAGKLTRLETLAEQILQELRRTREHAHVDFPHSDFSVSKLLAGIVQVVALAVAFLAYLNRDSGAEATLLCAIFLQCMTASLLIMSRQK